MSPYIQSLRPRTWPLSMAGIILGTGLSGLFAHPCEEGAGMKWIVFLLAILTTLSLQILSNLSNELGDALKGTDSDQHARAAYGLQTGAVTIPQIKRMIVLFIALSVLFGTALVITAFWGLGPLEGFGERIAATLLFLGLGLLAIIGAMTYTLGKHSYGYIGLGDLGVFLFFGLLSTIGSFYLFTGTVSAEVVCAAVALGLPVVGVLNLNNIRDMPNDRIHGKRTFASLLGPRGARIYQAALLAASLALFAAIGRLWTLLIAPVWIGHVIYIFRHDGGELDKQMPILMVSAIILAALACL